MLIVSEITRKVFIEQKLQIYYRYIDCNLI